MVGSKASLLSLSVRLARVRSVFVSFQDLVFSGQFEISFPLVRRIHPAHEVYSENSLNL